MVEVHEKQHCDNYDQTKRSYPHEPPIIRIVAHFTFSPLWNRGSRFSFLVMGQVGSLGGGTRRCRSRLFVSHPAHNPLSFYGAGVEPITGVSVSANPQCDVDAHQASTWDAHQATRPR